MNNDLYPQFATLTQRQIGEYFGESSHVIGNWLRAAGLRGTGSEPTPAAIDAGFAEWVDLGDGRRPFWAWAKKTVEFLEEAGHRRPLAASSRPPLQFKLKGPFSTRRCDPEADGHEVVDANGVVGVWVRGEEHAQELTKLMNLAHQHRELWK